MTTALNFVLGMIVIFLFVSLFVTTIQELVAQALALRARYLRVGITKLLEQGKSDLGVLGARSGANSLVDRFYNDPLIQSLGSSRPGRTSEPSYVSRETFTSVALQLTDMIASQSTPDQILTYAKDLKNKADATPLEHAIGVFAEETGGNLKKLQSRLGDWFDESMERVGGAYKRWTQIATIIIGICFAGALNVDSIAIARSLMASPETAAVVADIGKKISENQNADPELRKQLSVAIEQSKLPFGWGTSQVKDAKDTTAAGAPELAMGPWYLVLVGWILTGLAASLGSSFWFDALKRVVSIRSAGINPSEKPSLQT